MHWPCLLPILVALLAGCPDQRVRHPKRTPPDASSREQVDGGLDGGELVAPASLPGLPETVRVQILPEPAPASELPLGLSLPAEGSLERFFAKLEALKAGARQRVRVSVWGDSHVAADVFTGRLRWRLQEAFGDAGPGVVLIGRPWRYYRHSTTTFGQSRRRWRSERIWKTYSRKRRKPRDDHFGVAGITVHSRGRATAWLEPRRKRVIAALEVHYLRQPDGGRLDVLVDGKRLRSLLTAASRKIAAVDRVKLPGGARRVSFVTSKAEVRLFGVDLESGAPGVTLDAFGINGGRSDRVLAWNARSLASQVNHLAPDLIVTVFGSNSVDQARLTAEGYAKAFNAFISRMRGLAPGADCLVVGPPAQAVFSKERKAWEVPERLDWIVSSQRQVALRRGCVFWDWRAVMGGPKSALTLVAAEPPLMRSDHVHLTFRGYGAFGDALYGSLMALMRRQAPSSVSRSRINPQKGAPSPTNDQPR